MSDVNKIREIVIKLMRNDLDLIRTLNECEDKVLVNIIYSFLIRQDAATLGQLFQEVKRECQSK